MAKGRILVVDDDAFFRAMCTDILSGAGYAVKAALSGLEAVEICNRESFDIVITDLVMPDIGGLDVLQKVKQLNALTNVILVTGYATAESAIKALRSGAFDYIMKPLNEDELMHTVNGCMEKKKLFEENLEIKQSLKLYEISRAISTTLDINRLYNISIDALLQILPADAGMVVFYEDERKKLEVKTLRHISVAVGDEVCSFLKESLDEKLKGLNNVATIKISDISGSEYSAVKAYESLLVAPVMRGSLPSGFIIVFSTHDISAFQQKEVTNVAFIADHISVSFENAQKYAEAKEMAFIDSLTNLYNSKYLETVLDREIKRAERLMLPLTVLFMDLDNFKRINDLNDHLVGSKVLVEVGKILLKCVREVDTVIRYGGDEYVVILLDADYNVSMRVAERIRATIEGYHFLIEDSLDLRITASIGLASYPVHTRDKKELLKQADKAMYRAKDISRNLVYLAPLPGLV